MWLYHRFNLSQRDIEDLLAERGITLSYESIRLWCNKFGPIYKRRLKRRHRGFGDTFYLDEVVVKIQGKQQHLWRAVDQDGEVVDVFLRHRRDGAAAKRFLMRVLKINRDEPRKIVTDQFGNYCQRPFMIRPSPPIIAQSFPASQPEFVNEACAALNRCIKPSAF